MLQKLSDLQRVSARDLNKVIEVVNQVGDIYCQPPLEVARIAGRVQIRITDRGFAAKITSQTDRGPLVSPRYLYSVAEVSADPDTDPGLWQLVTSGRTLTANVYEWNDAAVDVDTVVWVEPFGVDDWRFQYPIPVFGCGFDQDDDGNIIVDAAGLAGCGLKVQPSSSSSSGCPATCAKLAVDVGALIGCGLKTQTTSSSSCGPTCTRVAVDVEALAGDGLTYVTSSSSCKLKVNPGCGLKIDASKKVAIDTAEVTGPAFSAITAIVQKSCGITYTVTPFNFLTNACGVFLGFNVGEGVDHDICLCTACSSCSSCSSSSSSSSSSVSSSSSSLSSSSVSSSSSSLSSSSVSSSSVSSSSVSSSSVSSSSVSSSSSSSCTTCGCHASIGDTVTVTISSVTCPGINSFYTCTWNGTTWHKNLTGNGYANATCDVTCGPCWNVQISGNCDGITPFGLVTGSTTPTVNCDPFHVTFTGQSIGGCCTASDVEVDITL